MKKELQKQESNEVVIPQITVENEFTAEDIAFPKLWLMQGQSKAVAEKKASIGDFWTTLEEKVIEKPVFIPIHMRKICFILKKQVQEKKFRFSHVMPVVTKEDATLKWHEKIGNEEIKREYAFMFFVLLKEFMNIPHTIIFKSTAYSAGKKLATQMYAINKMAKNTIFYPAAVEISIDSTSKSNDDGTFAVPMITLKGLTSKEYQAAAGEWYSVIKSMDINMDDMPPEVPSEGLNNKQEQY